MKITQTPDVLIIENRPWIIGTIFGLLMFATLAMAVFMAVDGNIWAALGCLAGAAFVLLFIWAFVRRNQLILDRPAGTVTHSRRTVFRYTRRTYNLSDLARASVQSSTTDKGNSVHRMALHFTGGMDEGVHPFVDAFVSGGGSHRSTDAVNDWLGDNTS